MNRYFLYATLGLLLAAGAAAAQGMKIMPGTTFKLTGGPYTLVLANDAGLDNRSAVQAPGLTIKGTGTGTSNIGGNAALGFGQLQISKAAGESMALQAQVNVAGGVYFNSGMLDLNGENLILSDTAMLVGETAASHAMDGSGGAIQINATLDAPLAENPGNLGLIITSGATWGNTTIRRRHNTFTSGGGGSSVSRNFEVIPTNNTGLNAFLRMYYLDGELNSLNEGTLEFFQSVDGGTQWVNAGSVSRNTTQNFVNINGVQSMSLFTLSTTGNPLPVKFSELYASCLHNRAQLQWRAEDISDIAFFQVEKSKDGSTWQSLDDKIAVVPDATYTYRYSDVTEPYNYYRLQCVSADGKVSFSPVQRVNCTESGYVFSLLENPVQESIGMAAQLSTALQVTAIVSDMQGRVLKTELLDMPAGYSRQVLAIPALAAGLYQLQLRHGGELLWQAKVAKR